MLMDKTKQPSLKVNVIINGLYQILIMIVPFFTAPYVARVLGSDGIGINSYTNSIVTYFTLFSALGTVAYGTREISRKRDDKIEYSKSFWEIESISIACTLFSLLLWFFVCAFYSSFTTYFLILSFNILSSCFNIGWFYAGLEKYKYTVSINALFKVSGMICIFLFVKKPEDLWIYMLINSLVLLLGDLSMRVFLPKNIVKTKIEVSSLKIHFKNSFVYFIPTIATSIYTVFDKTLIGLITNDSSQNGFYDSAVKIIAIVQAVAFTSINGVMSSRASYLFKQSKDDEARNLCLKTYDITMFFSVGSLFGLISVSEYFIPLFYGEGFEPAIYLMYILSFLIPIICLSNVLGFVYYTPKGYRKKSTIYLICGSCVNLVLNLILIPFLGAFGAAIASVVAESVISILFVYNARIFISPSDIFKKIWKKIVSGLIMMIIIFVLNKFALANLNLIFILIIDVLFGGLIYLIVLAILKDSFLNFAFNILKKMKK